MRKRQTVRREPSAQCGSAKTFVGSRPHSAEAPKRSSGAVRTVRKRQTVRREPSAQCGNAKAFVGSRPHSAEAPKRRRQSLLRVSAVITKFAPENRTIVNHVKDILRPFLRVLLPLLFISYMGSVISFTHVHIVDGDDQQSAGHTHTLAQFQLLHQLYTILSLGKLLLATGLTAFWFLCRRLLSRPACPIPQLPARGVPSLRAPPVA